jgi:hypothetical protein
MNVPRIMAATVPDHLLKQGSNQRTKKEKTFKAPTTKLATTKIWGDLA